MKSGKIKIGLLGRIVIAIALGIVCGQFFPMWTSRIFVTFNGIFSQFLGFSIPFIIIGFVAPSIADIGHRAGRMLVVTALLAYGATILAGLFSFGVSSTVFPSMIGPDGMIAAESDGIEAVKPYFAVDIPPVMPVMTALVTAFVAGFGAAYCNVPVFKGLLNDVRDVISLIIRSVIIPLLPVYIFGIFLDMTVAGKVGPILATFSKIIVVIFVMHVALLVAQYAVAALFRRGSHNPFKMLWTMMPAYFTALGTQSSAATIPVTLKQTRQLGVDEDVAGFVVPLCATIHMSGSTLKIVACAVALMITAGHAYDFSMFAGFIAMLGITIIAAPGVPGGAIMASLGLLSTMLGFSEADNALMIALYIAMDSFGTACNVTGDGALAVIVNRFFGNKK